MAHFFVAKFNDGQSKIRTAIAYEVSCFLEKVSHPNADHQQQAAQPLYGAIRGCGHALNAQHKLVGKIAAIIIPAALGHLHPCLVGEFGFRQSSLPTCNASHWPSLADQGLRVIVESLVSAS